MKPDLQAQSPAAAAPERRHNSLVFQNLSALANDGNGLAWQAFHPGVEIHWLYREEDGGASAALIRFQRGASVPLHEHLGFEHIYVLSGSQSDGSGPVGAGSLMVHPPGTRHRIESQEGCLVLAIYEKPANFAVDDERAPA